MIGGAPDSPCREKASEQEKRPMVNTFEETTRRLDRIESKLDFILRQNSRKESVPLAPTAYSALAQAGMDPRSLSTHKVVTGLDDWLAEEIEKKGIAQQERMQEEGTNNLTSVSTGQKCTRCDTGIFNDVNQSGMIVGWHCKCQGVEHGPQTAKPKEDGDEQK